MTKNKILFVFTIATLYFAHYLNDLAAKPRLNISKQKSAINLDNQFLKIFSFGNKRLVSSLIWITTLLEADTQHYKKKDLNSWLFLRFNTIANLEPLFLSNYTFGGQYLAILKDDIDGAEVLLTKGIKHYPDNYTLNSALGYLYVFEKQDFATGYKFYKVLSQFPNAPTNIKSLLHKLKYYTSGNNLEVTYESLMITYNQTLDGALKQKLKSDLYAIKAQIDLDCLNQNHNNCNTHDFDGNEYIKKGQHYVAPKSFKTYELHFR